MIDVQPADYDIESLAPGEAVAVDWTMPEYLDDRRALTRSILCNLDPVDGDPAAVRAWQLRTGKREETDQMSFGTLVHLACLEPAEFGRRVRVRGGGHIDASKFGFARGQFTGPEYGDTLWVDVSTFMRLMHVYWSISQHRGARLLLTSPGRSEVTVVWRHPETGLLVKARADRLTRLDESAKAAGLRAGWTITDIKTSRTPAPRPFLRSARYTYGYVDQGAIYTDAFEALLGEPVTFLLLAVGNEPRRHQVPGLPPHEVAVYGLGDREIDRARNRYTDALQSALRRNFTNDWRHSWEDGALTLGDE